MVGGGHVTAGAPTFCVRCRTPFTPSTVAPGMRAKAHGLMCPRCRRVEKAEKKAKRMKTEGGEK